MAQRATCDRRLQLVADDAIQIYNFSFLKGHRGQVEQDAAFAAGNSKLRWPNGNHNALPSRAMDLAPYHQRYGRLIGNDAQVRSIAIAERNPATDAALRAAEAWVVGMIREHYCHMAGVVLACGALRGIRLRWGADWNGDQDLFDNSFDDLGHFELID